MASYPFLITLPVTLTASGVATASYAVPPNEQFEVLEIRQKSTGAFNVTDIRDSKGRHYTNASPSVEIPGDFFADVEDNYNGYKEFAPPIMLSGSVTLYIDLEDTSAAGNTVVIVLRCTRTTP